MSATLMTEPVPGVQIAPGPQDYSPDAFMEEYRRDPVSMTLRLQKQYGGIVRAQIGPFLTHQITDPDLVRHVLQDNNRNYVRGKFYEVFEKFMGHGLLTSDGDHWLQNRRIAQPGFHRQTINGFSQTMSDCISNMLNRWREQSERNEPIDLLSEAMNLSIDCLSKLIFSLDVSVERAEVVHQATKVWSIAMLRKWSIVNQDAVATGAAYDRRVERARNTMREFIYEIIDAHHQGQHSKPDLVSMLLEATDATTGERLLTDEQVHDELMTIFLAGHETTGTALSWALFTMCQHPDVYQRVDDEVTGVLGTQSPRLESLEALPYSRAVIEETLRIYPSIWAFPRDAVNDDVVGGYHIPAGSTVFISPYATHRFPGVWENPEVFDPERFIGDGRANWPRFAYFPFGGGPRLCIGNHLALLEMQLAIPMILQFCRLELVESDLFRFGYAPSLLSLHPLQGFLAKVHLK